MTVRHRGGTELPWDKTQGLFSQYQRDLLEVTHNSNHASNFYKNGKNTNKTIQGLKKPKKSITVSQLEPVQSEQRLGVSIQLNRAKLARDKASIISKDSDRIGWEV